MTTEIDEPMELVEPDQYSGSPSSSGSAEGSMTDSLSVPPVRDPVQEPDPLPVPIDHPLPDGQYRDPKPRIERSKNTCDAEFEACYLLRQQGWIVSRWQGNPSPPDLIAVQKDEILLIMVRRSRQPVPDGHAVFLRYREGLACLRDIGSPAVVRKEAWILAPPDGWRCYEVLPGGIRRIRREWGRKGGVPEPGEETPFRNESYPQSVSGTGTGEAG